MVASEVSVVDSKLVISSERYTVRAECVGQLNFFTLDYFSNKCVMIVVQHQVWIGHPSWHTE